MGMDDIEDSDIDTGDDSAGAIAASGAAPASAPAPAMPAPASVAPPAAPPMNPMVQTHLQALLAQNKQALADAQQKSAGNALIAGIARAGGTFANAANPNRMDESTFNALDSNAQAPVNAVLAAQKGQAQTLSNAAEQASAERQAQMADPNSPQSKNLQTTIAKIYPGKYAPDQLKLFSASDVDSVLKPLELDEKIQERKEGRADTASERSDKAESKTSAEQAKAYTTMRKDLESFRGNKMAAQAAMDTLSADKAVQLVGNKDPNTLTLQDLSLLSGEMSKIATGGVPTEHGIQALMPSNLQTKLAEMQNFVSSKPTDAEAGDYIRKNMAYLREMRAVAQRAVSSYRQNIAKGYKNRVSADDYQEAVADYDLGTPAPATTQPPADDSVAMIDPTGKTRKVPKAMVQQAIAHGGKLVGGP